MTSRPLPLLLILLIALSTFSSTSAARCHPEDEAGLLAFKSGITSDPSGMLSSWKPGTECCSWPHVFCEAGRVSTILLVTDSAVPNSNLSGTISPSLSRLSALAHLYIQYFPAVTGPLPSSLSSLPNLVDILIIDCGLSGPLPHRLPGPLQILDLSGNRISGGIPHSISTLTNLTYLELGRNLLSGDIPPETFSPLRNLVHLGLDSNQFSGPVPDLSPLTDLSILVLSRNRFSGPIPPTLSALTSLYTLDLSNNKLTGGIPDFLGGFTLLLTVNLAGNQLTGTVPPSFANLTFLDSLDLSGNRLVDPFPALKADRLGTLHLSYNRFKLGAMPYWINSKLVYMESLKLAGCGLRMDMEDWKPQVSGTYGYEHVDVSDNEIRGSPAKFLQAATDLFEFRAAGNKLRFNVTRLQLPTTLRSLDLSRNLGVGAVPAGMAKLDELNLSYNHLCGRLPENQFPPSAFVGNDCLCGPPLPPCES